MSNTTCLVVGNGASLKTVPLKFLSKYPAFGSNRVYLLDGFTPFVYATINSLVATQYADEINGVYPNSIKVVTPKARNIVKADFYPESSIKQEFSMNPFQWINEGYTVTYVLLQLAYFMGFTTVLLVGVDHYYKFSGKPNQAKIARGKDTNHFSDKYFSGGVTWQNPDLANSEKYYNIAKRVYENDGRRIVNITKNTHLDVFDLDDIDNWS